MKNRGKRWLAGMLGIVMSFAAMSGLPATADTQEPGRYLLGDVNFDGTVGATDLTVLARAVADIEELPMEGYQFDGVSRTPLGDLNLDGAMGADDLTALARHVAKITVLPDTVYGYPGSVDQPSEPAVYYNERIQTDVSSTEEVYNTPLNIQNPVIPTAFADPELHRFVDEDGNVVYWIYATAGSNVRAAYSTDNMSSWTVLPEVVDMSTLTWIDESQGTKNKIWAPSCLYKDGKYYLAFSNGDSHADNPNAGINITVSDNPGGPFVAYTDGPIVWEYDETYSALAIIDQDLFVDEDGQIYMYYGGGGVCFAVKLNDTLTGLVPFDDGETYRRMVNLEGKNINNYMEAPYMIKRGDTYYMMYSAGVWSNASYNVQYATSKSPIGPWEHGCKVLGTVDKTQARGPGHHSAIYLAENNQWLICYHRWDKANNFGEGDTGRLAAIDRLVFNENGTIRSVNMTFGWSTDDEFEDVDASNLAATATVTDHGGKKYGTAKTEYVNDGNAFSFWQLNDSGAPGKGNCWLQMTFPSTVKTTTSTLTFENGTRATAWELQYSTDGGTTWVAVPNVTYTEATVDDVYTLTLSYPELETSTLRFMMTKGNAGAYSVKVFEWEVRGQQTAVSGVINNPIVDHDALGRFYGDPEIHKFGDKYYIYSTTSQADRKQTNMDVFVSDDMVNWTQVKDILNMADFPQTTGCIWAPSVIKRGEYYYISFSINDIQWDSTTAGLMMARSKNPTGPFVKYFEGPLIGRYIYGAQPIDGNFFEDDDGTVYFYYGGHANCNVCVMNETMDGFIPFEPIAEGDDQATIDSKTFKSMTQSGNMGKYVEGSFVIKRNGVYYLMWSVGSYVDSTYGVEYGIGDNPLGPFTFQSKILETDLRIASGPGHHSCLYLPEEDKWIICYHRREPDATTGTDRRLCIDELVFDENGLIMPVKMTDSWDLTGTHSVYTDTSLAMTEGATYSASSSAANFPAEDAFDDCAADKHRWAQGNGSAGQWLAVDFGSVQTFDSVALTFEASGAGKFILQTSEDGSTWTDITDTLVLTDLDKSFRGRMAFFYFAETSSRYLRLYFPQGSSWLSVYEWEIYNAGEGDRVALGKALAGAITDTSGYTSASAEVYDTALAYARAAYAREEVAQKELVQALKYLRKAKLGLVERPAEGENLAPLATASASFTKNAGMLQKLNDGNDDAANRWTEHTNSAAECAWIQYDFDEAVTVSEMQIKWYHDGAELWTPIALDIQYWNGTEYVSVTPTNTWGFTGNAYNVYAFEAVTSTSFRLQPTRSTGTRRYVGINEWKLFAPVS